MSLIHKLFVVMLMLCLISLYGCESCIECSLTYKIDEQTNRDTMIVRTQCSKRTEREMLEEYFKDQADENNGTYKCMIKDI